MSKPPSTISNISNQVLFPVNGQFHPLIQVSHIPTFNQEAIIMNFFNFLTYLFPSSLFVSGFINIPYYVYLCRQPSLSSPDLQLILSQYCPLA